MRQSQRDDQGFSVAEVVVAAAILFFVLTAMIGLVGASQKMSVAAKQRTVVTNAVAQYIERIRAIDYDTLDVGPGGALPAAETVSYGGYSVTFGNRIVFPDGENGDHLKTIYINVSSNMAGKVYKTSAVVNIKNPDNDVTAASLEDPERPQLQFISPTPPSDSVLWSQWVFPGGTSARLRAYAQSPNDEIVQIQYWVNGVLIRDGAGSSGSEARWDFEPGVPQQTVEKTWNTLQDGVPDGFQLITAIARDSQGRATQLTRRYIIDNQVPSAPGAPTAAVLSSTLGRLTFGAAADGNQAFASRYTAAVRREPVSGVTDPSTWSVESTASIAAGATTVSAVTKSGTLRMDVALQPFSRYSAEVYAGSPRDYNWAAPSRTAAPFISRPEIVSTPANQSTCSTNAKKNQNVVYSLTLWVTKPTFPVNNTATTYVFYNKDSSVAGAAWTPFDPDVGSFAVSDSGAYRRLTLTWKNTSNKHTVKPYYFKVGMYVTPAGAAPNAAVGPFLTQAAGIAPPDLVSNTDNLPSPPANLVTTWGAE